MAANYDGLLPTQSEAIVDSRGIITRKFRDFLAQFADASNADLQAQLDALAAEVAELADGAGNLATFVQGVGISIVGQITDPTIRISLNAYLSQLLDVSNLVPADGDSLVWSATDALWGPKAVDSTVPFFVPDGETFTVRENKQSLFTIPIVLGLGASLVIDGMLVEVS